LEELYPVSILRDGAGRRSIVFQPLISEDSKKEGAAKRRDVAGLDEYVAETG
jgi:hypothetical protein